MAVVEFPAGDGVRVYVQTLDGQAAEDGPAALSRAGSGDRVVRAATRTWEQSLEGLQAVAEGALSQLRQIDPAPDEVTVSFQVAVNAKLGATVVTAGTDAHLTVDVTWKAEKTAGHPGE
jgi:hypothetical protein